MAEQSLQHLADTPEPSDDEIEDEEFEKAQLIMPRLVPVAKPVTWRKRRLRPRTEAGIRADKWRDLKTYIATRGQLLCSVCQNDATGLCDCRQGLAQRIHRFTPTEKPYFYELRINLRDVLASSMSELKSLMTRCGLDLDGFWTCAYELEQLPAFKEVTLPSGVIKSVLPQTIKRQFSQIGLEGTRLPDRRSAKYWRWFEIVQAMKESTQGQREKMTGAMKHVKLPDKFPQNFRDHEFDEDRRKLPNF